MKTSLLCFALLMVLTLVSCQHPNEFKNAKANVPHATLRGTRFPNAGSLFASHINDQPTSFWRWSEVFRIPTGSNTCITAYSDRKETIGYEAAQFVAHPGREYVMTRKRERAIKPPLAAAAHPTTANAWIIQDRRDRVVIYENRPGGAPRLVADAPSKECVFGVPSSAAAIAEYCRKNPQPSAMSLIP